MSSPRFSIQATPIVVLFAALWGILWWQLSGEWSVNDQYSYGWFVPLFAIVLFWLRFEDANLTAGGRGGFLDWAWGGRGCGFWETPGLGGAGEAGRAGGVGIGAFG